MIGITPFVLVLFDHVIYLQSLTGDGSVTIRDAEAIHVATDRIIAEPVNVRDGGVVSRALV